MKSNESNKRMSKEARKKQIIEAAKTVFIKFGFSGSTTLEISRVADISEVTLFRYFSTKKEIFLEVVNPIVIGTLEQSLDTAKEWDAKAKLTYILSERIHMISTNYEIVKLILSEKTLLEEWGIDSYMDQIVQMFESMLSLMDIPFEKRATTLRLIMGSILSFLYMPEKKDENIKVYVQQITALIMGP